VVRYLSNGAPDTSFGTNGVSATAPAASAPNLSLGALAIQPDGRIVMAGAATASSTGGASSFALARFLGDSPTIGSFTASANPVTAGSSLTLSASNIVDLTAGATITQVGFYVDSNRDGKLDSGDMLLGYGTQTSPGVWTLTFSTTGWAPGTYTLFAQAEDSYGVFGDPFALTLTVL
jgi:hypothetical protein